MSTMITFLVLLGACSHMTIHRPLFHTCWDPVIQSFDFRLLISQPSHLPLSASLYTFSLPATSSSLKAPPIGNIFLQSHCSSPHCGGCDIPTIYFQLVLTFQDVPSVKQAWTLGTPLDHLTRRQPWGWHSSLESLVVKLDCALWPCLGSFLDVLGLCNFMMWTVRQNSAYDGQFHNSGPQSHISPIHQGSVTLLDLCLKTQTL